MPISRSERFSAVKMRANKNNKLSSVGSNVEGAFDTTSNYSLEIGIALILFGIVCGFFGKRFVKSVSFLTGFLVGAGVSLGLAATHLTNNALHVAMDPMKMIIVSSAGGTLLGILMFAFYKMMIFGIFGGLMAMISTFFVWEFAKRPEVVQYPIASAALIIGTFLAYLVPTFSTIVVTSGLGSYTLSVGIDCIIKSGFNHIFAFGFGYKWSQVGASTSDEVFGLMLFWIVMFLWMGVRQVMTKTPINSKDGKFKIKKNSVASQEMLSA